MGSYIVQTKSSWKAHTGLKSISGLNALMASKSSNTIFDFLSQFAHENSGLGDRLGILTDLTMGFGGLAVVVKELGIHVFQGSYMPEFLGCGPLEVVVAIDILDDLTLWKWLAAKDIVERDSGRHCLPLTRCLLFLLVILSLLFACQNVKQDRTM